MCGLWPRGPLPSAAPLSGGTGRASGAGAGRARLGGGPGVDRREGGHADREEFHVSYSVSGATRLMHRLGFSPQVPARRVAERDEQAVLRRPQDDRGDVDGASAVSPRGPPGPGPPSRPCGTAPAARRHLLAAGARRCAPRAAAPAASGSSSPGGCPAPPTSRVRGGHVRRGAACGRGRTGRLCVPAPARSVSGRSTSAIFMPGRRPGVTSRGTVASPSFSRTSAVMVRVWSVPSAMTCW